jgi:hypothetical protein
VPSQCATRSITLPPPVPRSSGFPGPSPEKPLQSPLTPRETREA